MKLSESLQSIAMEASRSFAEQLELCLQAVDHVYGLNGVYRVIHVPTMDAPHREDVMRNGEKMTTVRLARVRQYQFAIMVDMFDASIAAAYNGEKVPNA